MRGSRWLLRDFYAAVDNEQGASRDKEDNSVQKLIPVVALACPPRRNEKQSWERTHFVFFVWVLGSIITILPFVAHSQERKNLRVGSVAFAPLESQTRKAFLKRMAELGYERGRNFTFEYIRAPNRATIGKAYQELVTRKVDIILACGQEICLKSALATTCSLDQWLRLPTSMNSINRRVCPLPRK